MKENKFGIKKTYYTFVDNCIYIYGYRNIMYTYRVINNNVVGIRIKITYEKK